MVLITDKEMHVINNKLAIIIGNIDIGKRKKSLNSTVIDAGEDLHDIVGNVLDRHHKIQKILDPDKENYESERIRSGP